MLLRIVLSFIFLLFCNSLSAADQSVASFNRDFSNDVNDIIKKYDIPGAAYIIVKDGKIAAVETYGHTDKSKKYSVKPDTVFRLASVSKTFAATVTTMLASEQQLDLSDKITKYVPNFSLATTGAADKIELQHLLSHTSGLMPNAQCLR